MKKSQTVLMKGTKDGIILRLDDQCSFQELKDELSKKLGENSHINENDPLLSVKVEIGNRYLTAEQIEELKEIIREKKNLVVSEIESNVITAEEAERIRTEEGIVSVAKIIRSGQVLEVPGDLLLIGDVNPGGKIVAGGNIFVMGALKGMAHAGARGDSNAVISASLMVPSQLRINNSFTIFPREEEKKREHAMECAYVDENEQIVIDRLQVLMKLRPNLTRLEGGF